MKKKVLPSGNKPKVKKGFWFFVTVVSVYHLATMPAVN